MVTRFVLAAVSVPIIFLASLPSAASVAHSQLGAAPPVAYSRSCEKKAMTTLAIDRCAASELAQLQRHLDAVLSSASSDFGRRLVNTAEARWMRFRDAECLMEASTFVGGSAHSADVLFCEVSLTVKRIVELRQAISNIPH
jgi:uncharacterized protein YecT (DUF1311 family)